MFILNAFRLSNVLVICFYLLSHGFHDYYKKSASCKIFSLLYFQDQQDENILEIIQDVVLKTI
jgi:hypothetical protein